VVIYGFRGNIELLRDLLGREPLVDQRQNFSLAIRELIDRCKRFVTGSDRYFGHVAPKQFRISSGFSARVGAYEGKLWLANAKTDTAFLKGCRCRAMNNPSANEVILRAGVALGNADALRLARDFASGHPSAAMRQVAGELVSS